MTNMPFAESCEQNKEPILAVIKQWFTREDATVLEIGSGTGQHANYFPKFLNNINWQPSDTPENIAGIEAWRQHTRLPNVSPAITLDVTHTQWPINSADYIFSANTVHIMSWPMVQNMFAGIRSILKPNGIFCLYGPFNYNGQFSSRSNAQFDQWLKSRDPLSGVRDFEALCSLGNIPSSNPVLELVEDHEMPTNNRILVFKSQPIL